MKQGSKKEIVNRYQERISKFGHTFESLGSGSKKHQAIRFNILRQSGIKTGDSILDVGCGLGDFYDFLLTKGINVNYHGIDLVPEFIEKAKEKYPQSKFQVRDILKNPFDEDSFDYVVCSQVLNFKLTKEDNIQHAQNMLKKMNIFAKESVACDFLTSYVDYKEDHLFYYRPEEIFSFCKSLSKKVDLIHSYPLFEFCIFLYNDFEGWKNRYD